MKTCPESTACLTDRYKDLKHERKSGWLQEKKPNNLNERKELNPARRHVLILCECHCMHWFLEAMHSIFLDRLRLTDLDDESLLPSKKVGPSFLSLDWSWPVCCKQILLEFQISSAGICDWSHAVNHMLMFLCLDWMRINIIIRKRPWRSHCGFKSLREQQQFREKRLIKRIREF